MKKYPSHDEFEECDEMVDVADVADVFDKNGKQSRNITVNFYQRRERSLRYTGSKSGQKRITRGSNKERFIQAKYARLARFISKHDIHS